MLYPYLFLLLIIPLLQLEVSPAHVMILKQGIKDRETLENLKVFTFPLDTHAYDSCIAVLCKSQQLLW